MTRSRGELLRDLERDEARLTATINRIWRQRERVRTDKLRTRLSLTEADRAIYEALTISPAPPACLDRRK